MDRIHSRCAPGERGESATSAASCLAAACLALVLACASDASAQPLAPIDPLDRYDLTGDRTVAAVRGLRSTTPSGARVPARFDAVRAAVDLWLIAYLDTDHDDLATRLARALGVPEDALATELRVQLEHVPAADAPDVRQLRASLELMRALATEGTGVSFADTFGLRRDALLVDAVARAIAVDDRRALVAMIGDPCAAGDPRGVAGAATCPPPWSGWSPASRATIAAVAEASAAARRLADAAARGDAFARAAAPTLAEPRATIASYVFRPVPRVGLELPCGTSVYDEERAVEPDVIVAVSRDSLSVSRVSPVRFEAGRIVPLLEGEDVSPLAWTTSIADDRIGSFQALVFRLREMDLPSDATIAIAAADDVPATVLGRVLMSLDRMALPPSVLVRRGTDGSLRGVAIQVLERRGLAHDGDLVIRAREAGYVVTRGGDTALEAPNEEALWHRLGRAEGRRVVIDATGHAPVAELYDAVFRLGRGRNTVSIVTP